MNSEKKKKEYEFWIDCLGVKGNPVAHSLCDMRQMSNFSVPLCDERVTQLISQGFIRIP